MAEPPSQPAADCGAEIRDAVGNDVLAELLAEIVDLVPTAAAIHGRGGACVLDAAVCGWCRLLRAAQGRTNSFCWTDVARRAVETGRLAEGECPGGLTAYSVPITSGDEALGAVSLLHGNPPADPRRIAAIAAAFGVDAAELTAQVAAHPVVSEAAVDMARRHVRLTARMIGLMVGSWRAERALRAAEERFTRAVRAGKVGVWDYDPATERFVSLALREVYGFDQQRVADHRDAWLGVIHPEDRDRVWRAVQDHLAGRTPRYCEEHRVLCPDGQVCWVLSTGTAVRDDTGRAVSLLGTTTDITELKQVQEERARLEAQLRQAQKMEALGQLAGGVAHDFNNLLTAILGHVELAQEQAERGSMVAVALEQIGRAGQRAAALTRQLLAFSRRQPVRPELLNPNRVVEEMELMLRRLLGETITLELRLSATGYVRADAGHLEQVVMNLVVNARDAMPEGGRLTIETADALIESPGALPNDPPPGAYVVCAVADTGVGMDAATLDRLFEPFFTTKPPGRGTGLGLSTVYGIVKQAGGHVRVASDVGQGTTFRVFLPRVELPDRPPAPPAPLRPVHSAERTVLVCEDEEPVRALACEILRRGGYRVIASGSGAEATRGAAAHDGPVHLLVSDMILPDGDGRHVAATLRRRYPDLRVLFISGYTADVIERHGELEPDVEFLEKPFTPSQLLQRVRALLEGAPAPR